jgi:hypothetical protein
VDIKSDKELENGPMTETGDTRRDVARKLGRFAAYAAPFTVLALSAKAGTSSGPGPKTMRPH